MHLIIMGIELTDTKIGDFTRAYERMSHCVGSWIWTDYTISLYQAYWNNLYLTKPYISNFSSVGYFMTI